MTPTTAVATQTEQLLDRLGVPYTLDPEFPLDKIDVKASHANQARDQPLDPEKVAEYKLAAEGGAIFPSVVLRKVGRRYVALGGNHRIEVHHLLGRTTISALIAEPATDQIAIRIAYEDNSYHGHKPSGEERARHGAHLVDACGYSIKDAAIAVNISTASISQERSAASAFHRAKDLKVSHTAFAALPKASRYALSQIQQDAVFADAARLTIDAGLGTDDVGKLCKKLKNARSEKAALDTIKLTKTERRAQIQQTKGTTARARDNGTRNESVGFQRHLWGITEGPGPARIRATCPGPDHQKRLLADIDKTIATLEAVRTELRKRK